MRLLDGKAMINTFIFVLFDYLHKHFVTTHLNGKRLSDWHVK